MSKEQLKSNENAVSKALPSSSGSLVNWAFRRPCCAPEGGFVLAYTAAEAISLVHGAYGYASSTSVFSPLLNERWQDQGGGSAVQL